MKQAVTFDNIDADAVDVAVQSVSYKRLFRCNIYVSTFNA